MESYNNAMLYVWLSLAAMAGAVSSLAAQPWQKLSPVQIVLNLIAGFSFAIYVTPLVLHQLLGVDSTNTRLICGVTYIFGAGSNILLPMAIRWLGRAFGNGERQ